MSKSRLPRPTEAELEILRVLWARGPSTVRQIFETPGSTSSGYTTVLKLLQIMHQKGLVRRDESDRSHVYRAARSREHTEHAIIGDLLARVFDGSASRLVMQALAAKPTPPEELDEIRRLLDERARQAPREPRK
jgi:BlaI family transcriptional regulator, penicillinase repressor